MQEERVAMPWWFWILLRAEIPLWLWIAGGLMVVSIPVVRAYVVLTLILFGGIGLIMWGWDEVFRDGGEVLVLRADAPDRYPDGRKVMNRGFESYCPIERLPTANEIARDHVLRARPNTLVMASGVCTKVYPQYFTTMSRNEANKRALLIVGSP